MGTIQFSNLYFTLSSLNNKFTYLPTARGATPFPTVIFVLCLLSCSKLPCVPPIPPTTSFDSLDFCADSIDCDSDKVQSVIEMNIQLISRQYSNIPETVFSQQLQE